MTLREFILNESTDNKIHCQAAKRHKGCCPACGKKFAECECGEAARKFKGICPDCGKKFDECECK